MLEVKQVRQQKTLAEQGSSLGEKGKKKGRCVPSGSNARLHGVLVLEQPSPYGDSDSREKCSGMMEQTHCGSHPDYPSKNKCESKDIFEGATCAFCPWQ